VSAAYVLGDWGSTRLRLFRLVGGDVTDRAEGPGITMPGTVPARALAGRLAAWPDVADVTLCGMAGARGGLIEADYVPCPAAVDDWRNRRVRTEVQGVAVAVMAGLSDRSAIGVPDVMRGEETQVFGAVALDPALRAGDHRIVLPGTHGKWARVVDGTVQSFRTCPTGELFALLGGASTLTGDDKPGRGDFDQGFARGLERAGEATVAALFEARAARLLDGRGRDWSRGYLSGLLIGSEVAAQADGPVVLIGDPTLCGLYGQALTAFGHAHREIDGDAASLAGLKLARGTA
jgi:2-dehydro-3-deoxygalactonokinase